MRHKLRQSCRNPSSFNKKKGNAAQVNSIRQGWKENKGRKLKTKWKDEETTF